VLANVVRSLADGHPFLGAHDVIAVDGGAAVLGFEGLRPESGVNRRAWFRFVGEITRSV
jgi:hypothetical protein